MEKMNMRILRYSPKTLYANKKLVNFLSENLNNSAEQNSLGSGMKSALLWERNMLTWVCWLSGEPVGWATLTPRNNDKEKNILGVSVYVNPDFRRMGIGTKLCKKIKIFCAKNNLNTVAQPWDRAGKSFYRKHGIKYTEYWDFYSNSLTGSRIEKFLS